jgi:PadR family transcriptional regulator, regulatory protein AphA
MELNATAKVILGMLAARPRSGYEIKQLVDGSTRFFWSASYGQIYPELKRLEKEGLVAGSESARGARKRTIYKLTPKGRKAAKEWIDREPETFELRDEGLLGLFFAESIEPGRAPEIAREQAAKAAADAAALKAIQKQVTEPVANDGPEVSPDRGSLAVLRYGIESSEWTARWFERLAEDLENGSKET